MFVIRNDKSNNAVRLLTEAKEVDFRFVNQLTNREFTQRAEGVKDGDYTVFLLNGTDIKGGEYMVYVGDAYATMCLCVEVNQNIKDKYK